MQKQTIEATNVPVGGGVENARPSKRALIAFWIFAGALALVYVSPLLKWFQFAIAKERNTYLLLVPILVGYLIWTKRPPVLIRREGGFVLAIIALVVGAAAIAYVFTGDSVWTTDARN